MTTFAMPAPHPVIGVLLAITASRPGEVDVTYDVLRVRLGRSFRAEVPRSSITSAVRYQTRDISIGAHGWAGRWLVNTSTTGQVSLTIEPEGRGRCLGVPVRLRQLIISLADPDAFLRELAIG